MKTKRRALSNKNFPRRFNLVFYAVVWMLMDRIAPPMWVWGVVGTLCALIFIIFAIDFFSAEDVEL